MTNPVNIAIYAFGGFMLLALAIGLKTIVIFCGVGLVVSLLLAGALTSLQLAPGTNGLDIMYWI
jgi:hypothetical protein